MTTEPKEYAARVAALEAEGMTTGDAQAVADAEQQLSDGQMMADMESLDDEEDLPAPDEAEEAPTCADCGCELGAEDGDVFCDECGARRDAEEEADEPDDDDDTGWNATLDAMSPEDRERANGPRR